MSPKRSAAKLSAGGILAILVVIAVLLFLPDQSNPESTPEPSIPTIPSNQPAGALPSWLTVYFTNPNPPDDTSNGVDQYIVPLVDGATTSIDVASFDLNLPSVIDALVRAAERGVTVRVVYDGENGDAILDAEKSPTGKAGPALKNK